MDNNNMVMIKHARVLFILLIMGCTAQKQTVKNEESFEFINDGKMALKLDSVIVKDKKFKMQIPLNLLKQRTIVNDCFMNILEFKGEQKIVTLYIPNKIETDSQEVLDVSYKAFIKFCDKEDIFSRLEIMKVLKHRRFALYKKDYGRFYILYLNIKSSEIAIFNHSLKSVIL